MKVDNAVIMAAGSSTRFAPLSHERHKGLTVVRGEVLIEREIGQLRQAGIEDIYLVTGYKAEQFSYLKEKFGISLIHNGEYLVRNNNSSIWAARHVLGNTFICSSDNYFTINPFEDRVDGSYYAAQYAKGHTEEWCMTEDGEGYIDSVTIGGSNAWYMMGHAFWDEGFSRTFLDILKNDYDKPETAPLLWERIFMAHLDVLKMRIRRYPENALFEFDTLDELRQFDPSYITDTRSGLVRRVASELGVGQQCLSDFRPLKSSDANAIGFSFRCGEKRYSLNYGDGVLHECGL